MGLDMHQLIAKPGMGPSLFGDMSVGQYVVSSPSLSCQTCSLRTRAPLRHPNLPYRVT